MSNKRLGVLFSTSEDSHYFYDSGTGKIANCNSTERKLIDRILNDETSLDEACLEDKEFKDLIESENLFACPESRDFIIPTQAEFKEMLEETCEQIILELTEECNLRCDYCIYSDHHPKFRGFSNKRMSFNVAKKSIDIVLKNYKKERFALTFYGGEPLIEFDLMKDCIEYTKTKYPNIKIDVSFTTNLTLLTKEMVDYFKSLENVAILCSIDGPRDFHNKYRKYFNGSETFDDAINGFNMLLESFYEKGNTYKTIAINCVVVPPYSKRNLELLNTYFEDELKLPKDISVEYSYLDKGDMNIDLGEDGIISHDIGGALESSPLEEWAVTKLLEGDEESDSFSIVSKDMLRVAKRIIVKDGVIDSTFMHGNCVPGQRRIHVTVDGDFKLCENMGDSPSIGNHIEGYNIEKTYEKYYEEYVEYFEDICNDCWAKAMCGICYVNTIGEHGVKPYVEDKMCSSSKELILDSFVNYYRYLEKDRESLQEKVLLYERMQDEAEGVRKYEV